MIINVLGLGQSVHRYNGSGISIGVNDIYRYYPADYVVCVDKPDRFNPERRKIIEQSKPILFFSHLPDWEFMPNFVLMNLSRHRGDLSEIKSKYPYGTSSSYCAACIAYKLGATVIKMYGVDMNDHPNLKDSVRDGEVGRFDELRKFFKRQGVELLVTEESYLSKVLKPF